MICEENQANDALVGAKQIMALRERDECIQQDRRAARTAVGCGQQGHASTKSRVRGG